jgi:Fe-S oxidoreductase
MEAAKKEELLNLFESKLNNAMQLYLDICARCGICIDKCHVHASMPDTRNSAVYRAEVVRKLYRRYFKTEGKITPSVGEVTELSDELMDTLYEAAYSCTGCRRCMVYCPFGIDTQMIMSIAKLLLIGADKEPKDLTMLADMSIQKGKTIESTKENFAKAMQNIEKEVIARWQQEAGKEAIPLEKKNASVLYVALAGKHSIIPAAAIMNAAKENWTLSYYEAVNFGAFVGNPQKTKEISQRIIDEAKKLNVNEVVICECGTAFRVMRYMMGELPFKVITFVELMERYLKEDRIKLEKNKIQGRFTYHDPCQIARNSGIYDAPRYVISHLTDDFVEMTPNRKENWCCGGGGGLVAIRDKDYRMKTSRIKADQIKAVEPEILATACENCHTQLKDINDHYKLEADVRFLSDLVAEALKRD